MSAGAIRAGRAFVEFFAEKGPLIRDLRGMESTLKSWGSRMSSIGARSLAIGGALTAPFAPAIAAASEAAEGLNKFSAVFGTETAAASAFVDQLAANVGRSAVDIRDSLSSFQAMFVGLNFNPTEAREMAQSLQALSIDFASFYNLSDEEAGQRFLSGLSGSSEVFDKFGINTKAAALDQKLLQMGLAESTAKATEQQKVMARAAIIQEALTKQGAAGDAVKTAGSFANQTKRLTSELKDLAVTVGTTVLPVVAPFVSLAASAIAPIAEWIRENQSLVVAVLGFGAGLVAAGAAVLGLGTALSIAGTAIGAIITAATAAAGTLAAVFAALISPLGLVAVGIAAGTTAFLTLTETGQTALGAIGAYFSDLGNTARLTWGGIVDAVASGDLRLAGQIAVDGLYLAWLTASAPMMELWESWGTFFRNIWDGVATTISELMLHAFYGIQSGFFSVAESVLSVWRPVMDMILKAVDLVESITGENAATSLAKKAIDKSNEIVDRARAGAGAKADKINADRENAVASLREDLARRQDNREAARHRAAAARDKKIDDLRANLAALETRAAEQRAAAAAETAPAAVDQEFAAEVGEKAMEKTSLAVTNSFAASRIGGTSAIENIATYTKTSVEHLKTIADNTADLAPTYGD